MSAPNVPLAPDAGAVNVTEMPLSGTPLTLGAVWTPGVEFLPYFMPRQKPVTIFRVLITILLIFSKHVTGLV
jgi:hypothetical protein